MANFYDIINSPKPVLVDFYADWCGPCKMVAPVLKQLSGEIGDRAKIIKVDVDKNPQAATKYSIKGVPTLIIFKNGQPVWRQSGVVPIHMIRQALESYF